MMKRYDEYTPSTSFFAKFQDKSHRISMLLLKSMATIKAYLHFLNMYYTLSNTYYRTNSKLVV